MGACAVRDQNILLSVGLPLRKKKGKLGNLMDQNKFILKGSG